MDQIVDSSSTGTRPRFYWEWVALSTGAWP